MTCGPNGRLTGNLPTRRLRHRMRSIGAITESTAIRTVRPSGPSRFYYLLALCRTFRLPALYQLVTPLAAAAPVTPARTATTARTPVGSGGRRLSAYAV